MNFPDFKPSDPPSEKDFLYSVLNLPTSASQHDIKERHRALSVIFHPDKQQDDHTRDTAAKRFLEIQRAYEILSDPFLREVYDALGEEGLAATWPPDLRSKPADELRKILRREKYDRTQVKLERLVRPRGRVAFGISAISLFDKLFDQEDGEWYRRFFYRLQHVRQSTFAMRHSIQKALNENTKVTASAHLSSTGKNGGANIYGTVRHQFSPRWSVESTTTFLRPRTLLLQATYRGDDGVVVIQSRISAASRLFPPPLRVSLSRRLFRDSLTEGTLSFGLGPQPHVTISVITPTPFDLMSEFRDSSEDLPNEDPLPGSASGFGVGASFGTYVMSLAGASSSLRAEWGITFSELALQVKAGLEVGLVIGFASVLTGTWTSTTSEISTSVGLSQDGVFLRLDLAYLEQRLSIPILLSLDADAFLALCTAIVPSTAFVLGYHFILKPHRRAQRAAYFRAAREAVADEKTTVLKEARETASLLKETAKRHMQTESLKGGLVIIEATYGPTEPDEEGKALIVDATIAVQALVHNSQLYIPGHRSKAGIQGFYDPAPRASKSLRIRYLFRGRAHYAEIADYVPVVLPLADHLVPELSAVSPPLEHASP